MLNIMCTIRKLYVKTMRYHYTPIRMAKIKKKKHLTMPKTAKTTKMHGDTLQLHFLKAKSVLLECEACGHTTLPLAAAWMSAGAS